MLDDHRRDKTAEWQTTYRQGCFEEFNSVEPGTFLPTCCVILTIRSPSGTETHPAGQQAAVGMRSRCRLPRGPGACGRGRSQKLFERGSPSAQTVE